MWCLSMKGLPPPGLTTWWCDLLYKWLSLIIHVLIGYDYYIYELLSIGMIHLQCSSVELPQNSASHWPNMSSWVGPWWSVISWEMASKVMSNTDAGWWFGCHLDYFPIFILSLSHHPNWRSYFYIFFRGVAQPPTSYGYFVDILVVGWA